DIAASLMKVAIPITLVLTFFFATGATGSWMDVLRFINRTSFGVADPVFGKDIGWYVFVLPAIASVLGAIKTLVVLTLIGVLVIYFLRGKITLPPQRINLLSPAEHHVAGLLVAFLLLTALQTW